jgi:2-amino-4-hydroxy-6-hydroxymethyldihydropteridine diphosphokinase
MIVVGFGGNLGSTAERLAHFRAARTRLVALFEELESAALYATAPVGGPAQAGFLNTAVGGRYAGEPATLLVELQRLEAAAGRDRAAEERWGPRSLDLDVLVWDARVLATPELTVPHPRLGSRRFALAPLADLVGVDHLVPGLGSVGAALARVAAQEVTRVAITW